MFRVVPKKVLGEFFGGEAVISGPTPTTGHALPAHFTDIVTLHPQQALKQDGGAKARNLRLERGIKSGS